MELADAMRRGARCGSPRIRDNATASAASVRASATPADHPFRWTRTSRTQARLGAELRARRQARGDAPGFNLSDGFSFQRVEDQAGEGNAVRAVRSGVQLELKADRALMELLRLAAWVGAMERHERSTARGERTGWCARWATWARRWRADPSEEETWTPSAVPREAERRR